MYAGVLAIVASTLAACSTDDSSEPTVSATATTTATTAAPKGPVTGVVLVGDSLAVEAVEYLPDLVPDLPLVIKTYGGTAPCDWLPQDLGITDGSVTIMSFIGNAGTPCMAVDGAPAVGDEIVGLYREGVRALIELATAKGSTVILLGQPASRLPDLDAVADGLNEVYRELADELGVTFVDAGAALENDDGEFTVRLDCLPGETDCSPDGTIAVRNDDGLHLCPGNTRTPCPTYSSGAFRFASEMAAAINAESAARQ